MITLKSLLLSKKLPINEDFKSDATKVAKRKYESGDWDMMGNWKKARGPLTECAQAFIEGAMWAKAELEKKNKK